MMKASDIVCKQQCEHCGKDFPHTSHLYRHIRNVHKIRMYGRDPSKLINESTFQCNECSKVFRHRNSLYRHKNTHHMKEKDVLTTPNKMDRAISMKEGPKSLTEEEVHHILDNFPRDCSSTGIGNYNYRVNRSESRATGVFVEVEFSVSSILEAQQWKTTFEEKNLIYLRKSHTRNSKKKSVLYKQHFHCGHSTRCEVNGPDEGGHTNCSFRFHLCVRREDGSRLTARVRTLGDHNHNIGEAAFLKHRPVSEDVKDKFLYLFHRGYKPAKAMRLHENDLLEEYGEDAFKNLSQDRFHNPDPYWVYRLHASKYQKEYGEQYNLKILQNLTEKVTDFKHAKIKLLDSDQNYVVSMVTPFMLRVHEGIVQCSELIFVDSTGIIDQLNCKILILFTNSFAGSLPAGIIVTTLESEEAIGSGLRMILELVTKNSFGGRGVRGPRAFATDNNLPLRGALGKAFPEARLLLRSFDALQALWSSVWNHEIDINASDRRTLFSLFKSVICEKDVKILPEKIREVLENELVRSYPILLKRFQDSLKFEEKWTNNFSTDSITKGRKTDTVCEFSMRLVKEVILHKLKVYSPVQLFVILATEFEHYYTDKLECMCNGRAPKYLREKLCNLNKKSDALVYDDTTGVVRNTNNDQTYHTDVTIGLCSCREGECGKLCKHLLVALQECDLIRRSKILLNEYGKRKSFQIVTGKESDE